MSTLADLIAELDGNLQGQTDLRAAIALIKRQQTQLPLLESGDVNTAEDTFLVYDQSAGGNKRARVGTAATANTGTEPGEVPLNSDLGTAATADKQTSPTDTTAGRLMAVGAGGVLALDNGSTESTIPDSRIASQILNISASDFGLETSSSRPVGWLLGGHANFPNRYSFFGVTDNGPIRAFAFNGANLSPVEFYHTGNILGTVGQGTAGGDPVTGTVTGAIIERGSNSDGEYVKFADGTLICTRSLTTSEVNAISTDYGTTLFNFAIGFETNPAVAWSLLGLIDNPAGFDTIDVIVVSSRSPTQWNARARSSGLSGQSIILMALGRWF